MKCLIIDKVYAGIAEELSKYMEVKTAENLPSTKDQLLAEIGDVDSCTTGREMSGSLKIFLSAVFSSAREISWKNTWSWRRSSGRQGRRAGTASI